MLVGDIMTRRVVTVEMDDSLHSIRELFAKVRFHHLLVVTREGVLRGVISDRDVLKHMSPFLDTPSEQTRDAAVLRKPAHQIMTRKPVTAPPTMRVTAAARIFLGEKISCLPVTDPEGQVLGILTWRDILRASLEKQP